MLKTASVYILASRPRGTLYTGVTSNLAKRMHQHRAHLQPGFTSRHGVTRLVWYLHGEDIAAAITLEKKIKNRGRQWKVDLIEKQNPEWDDLAAAWMDPGSGNSAQQAPPGRGINPEGRMQDEHAARPRRWPA